MDEDAEGPAAEGPLLLLIMKERLRRLSRLPMAFWGEGSEAWSSSNRPGGHACAFSSCCICKKRGKTNNKCETTSYIGLANTVMHMRTEWDGGNFRASTSPPPDLLLLLPLHSPTWRQNETASTAS